MNTSEKPMDSAISSIVNRKSSIVNPDTLDTRKSKIENPKSYNMEILFRALADRTRLRLLNLMSQGEVCVCFFVEILGDSQPKISRHLAYLRRAGVVNSRREGKWIHYRIVEPNDKHAATVMGSVLAWLRQDAAMRNDLLQLTSVCCSPTLPAHLSNAPKPKQLVQIEV
jgi:ArsR family transcriptional regulator